MLGQWWRDGRWRSRRTAIAGAIVVLLVAAAFGGVLLARRSTAAGEASAAGKTSSSPSADPQPTVEPTPSPTPTPTPTPSPSTRPAGATTPASSGAGAPARFATLPPGSALPTGAQCAAWVRAQPLPESKRMNAAYNRVTGHRLGADFFPAADDPRANTQIGARVDGGFTGTTREILRWTACKWGADEDMVLAQAAKESWWRQTAMGDYGTDASACPPGHGLGVDGHAGQCPQSFGILQDRYPYERTAWPGMATSTAMNADTSYAIWRACFQGYERWLNDVERGSQYGPGDAWGCLGKAFAGRWHTPPGDQYIAAVQDYLRQRIWLTANFQEP